MTREGSRNPAPLLLPPAQEFDVQMPQEPPVLPKEPQFGIKGLEQAGTFFCRKMWINKTHGGAWNEPDLQGVHLHYRHIENNSFLHNSKESQTNAFLH